MTDERRPAGAARTSHAVTVAALGDAHARATRIAEAFDVGDFEFVALALPDLAFDLWTLVERLSTGILRCDECGLSFDWPAQLEQHVRVVHPDTLERAA